jgi:hypothetical protein
MFRNGDYARTDMDSRPSEFVGSVMGSIAGSNRSKINPTKANADMEFFKLLVLSFKMNNLAVFPDVMKVSSADL